MNKAENDLLQALSASLEQRSVEWETLPEQEMEVLFSLAQAHKVLPMVYQAVYGCPAIRSYPPERLENIRSAARRSVILQTRKTALFLPILEELRQAGVEPLVVKGVVCRSCYPYPDQRVSADEDLWIPPEQMARCRKILLERGFQCPTDRPGSYEIPFRQVAGPVYLEVHTSLFPPESRAYGDFNRFFAHARENAVEVAGVPTMAPTEHMLYLILHAFKHFLHSGFGIRQVCDIVLWANMWGPELDWDRLLENVREVRAEQFAAAVFQIGEKYLNFSREKAQYPKKWQEIPVLAMPLLEDILRAGVYGSADKNRQHSSRMTLGAVEAGKAGRSSGGLLHTLFPPAREMQTRYSYLQQKPWLLPVAWTERIVCYGRNAVRRDAKAPLESIQIGRERLALLQLYGVVDK